MRRILRTTFSITVIVFVLLVRQTNSFADVENDKEILKSGRSIKLSTSKKTISHQISPYMGIIIDKPQIKIVSYRVRTSDPYVIEENCSRKQVAGRSVYANCDQLVQGNQGNKAQREKIPKWLGQGEGETPEWLIPPNVTELVLECQSKVGPVEWDYVGHGVFPNIDIESRRQVTDFWKETSYVHYSVITFHEVNDQLTGKFVCRNVEKFTISNSFYMFAPQETALIYSSKSIVDVRPSLMQPTFTIPCRMKSRETSIYLYKTLKDGSLKKMNMLPGIDFDPYKGFSVPNSPKHYGHYVCKIYQEEDNIRRRKRSANYHFDGKQRISTYSYGLENPIFTANQTPRLENQYEMFHKNISALERKDDAFMYYTNAIPLESKVEKISDSEEKSAKQVVQSQIKFPEPVMVSVSTSSDSESGFYEHYEYPDETFPLVLEKRRRVLRRRPQPRPLNIPSFHFIRRSGTSGSHPPPRFPPHGNRYEGHHPRRPSPPWRQSLHRLGPKFHVRPPMTIPSAQGVGGSSVLPFLPIVPDLTTGAIETKTGKDTETQGAQSGVLPTYVKDDDKLSLSSTYDETLQMHNHLNKGKMRPTPFLRKPPRRGAAAILSQNLLPQTVSIMNSMTCVLKKVMLGPDASCNSSIFDGELLQTKNRPLGIKGFPDEQETILEVHVHPPPRNKFFPRDNVLYTSVPFFVKWQTQATDFGNFAEVNHTLLPGTFKLHKAGHLEDNGIHSFEVFNLQEDDSGRISVPYVTEDNEIAYHTWKFFVISERKDRMKGLTHRKEGKHNIFTCRSATVNKPEISMKALSENGCREIEKFPDENHYLNELDCGENCVEIRTNAETGVVKCAGDGVNTTFRYPAETHCSGRPYFVERGKAHNISVFEGQKRLRIPCIINNPNADVYLYFENTNGTVEEVTDHATYDLKVGFTLDLRKLKGEVLGTYACTSTTNLDDDSDMVTYNATPAPNHVFEPPEDIVRGNPPFRFVWESSEELIVKNETQGNFYSGVFASPEGNRPYIGTFEIKTLRPGESGEVVVVRKSNHSIVHKWKYHYDDESGLYVDKKVNVVKCDTHQEQNPYLLAVECLNPNQCKLKKKFAKNTDSFNLGDPETNRDAVFCGPGCTELKLWRNKPFGFVKCKGPNVNEDLNYFLSQNSSIFTESDPLKEFKTIRMSSVVRKLTQGETVRLSCTANKYFHSKGIQWAVEMKSKMKRIIENQSDDKNTFLNEIKSEITLKVQEEWKKIWCFVPKIDSNGWRNASQILYF